MTIQAKDQADKAASLPHVKAWINRFKKLSKEMPPEVWVYVAAGTPHIMAVDPTTKRMFERPKQDGSDPDAIIDRTSGGHWDGGDW